MGTVAFQAQADCSLSFFVTIVTFLLLSQLIFNQTGHFLGYWNFKMTQGSGASAILILLNFYSFHSFVEHIYICRFPLPIVDSSFLKQFGNIKTMLRFHYIETSKPAYCYISVSVHNIIL